MWDVEEFIDSVLACLTNICKTQKNDANTQYMKLVKFDLSRPINPQNKMDLNQGILRIWSKYVDLSLNGWWVIAQIQNGVHFDLEVKFDLEGQDLSPSSKIRI